LILQRSKRKARWGFLQLHENGLKGVHLDHAFNIMSLAG